MDVTLVGLLGVGLLLTLLAIGVPIAFAMAFTGALGLWVLEGASSTMALIALVPWEHGRSFVFVTIPLRAHGTTVLPHGPRVGPL